jgi:glucose/arabinose dehydrogenase
MNYNVNSRLHIQQEAETDRVVNPEVISVPAGYQIEAFATGLDTPVGITFTADGDILIADAGSATGIAKVIRLSNGQFETIAEGFSVPITGIKYWNRDIYVSHRGMISVIKPDGTRLDIISGLPSFGDYSNNCVTFGQDNKMYYGQGTATNSGVVGLDNSWIFTHPYFSDTAGSYITVNGYDFETRNVFIPAAVTAFTGAFSPFGVPNNQDIELLRGNYKASGSIMRANPDGSELELLAWGFRNPFQVLTLRMNYNYMYLENGMDGLILQEETQSHYQDIQVKDSSRLSCCSLRSLLRHQDQYLFFLPVLIYQVLILIEIRILQW